MVQRIQDILLTFVLVIALNTCPHCSEAFIERGKLDQRASVSTRQCPYTIGLFKIWITTHAHAVDTTPSLPSSLRRPGDEAAPCKPFSMFNSETCSYIYTPCTCTQVLSQNIWTKREWTFEQESINGCPWRINYGGKYIVVVVHVHIA